MAKELKNEMTVRGPCIDLFCGAGGLSCGFIQAGFDIRAGVDMDAAALLTFGHNHRNAIPIRADVSTLTGNSLREAVGDKAVFGLIGGPPCQGFSYAGKHDPNDIRNRLPYEYARLLRELQPAFFLMENVKGLLSKKQRVHFEAIMELFAGAGYRLDWKVLNAWDYGVAQTRERVFILGFRRDLDVSFIWPEPDPARPVLRDAIGDLPDPTTVSDWLPPNHALLNPRPPSMSNRMKKSGTGSTLFDCKVQKWEQPSRTITAHLSKDVDLAHPGLPPNHGPIPTDPKRILDLIAQADAEGVIPLDALERSLPSRVKALKNRQKAGAWHKPNPTITANSSFYTGAHFHPNVAAPRRFTVRECARIQSFEDTFVFWGSLSAQYRQVGNAVPPKLAYCLARQIAKAFEACLLPERRESPC